MQTQKEHHVKSCKLVMELNHKNEEHKYIFLGKLSDFFVC